MNIAKWNELPKAYQSAIITASNDAWVWTLSKYDYVNPPAMKRLVASGAILRAFPQPVLEDCYKAANETYDGPVDKPIRTSRNCTRAWCPTATTPMRGCKSLRSDSTASRFAHEREPDRLIEVHGRPRSDHSGATLF